MTGKFAISKTKKNPNKNISSIFTFHKICFLGGSTYICSYSLIPELDNNIISAPIAKEVNNE